ncbi:hypothetical protein OC842_006172 [Tilletia horrida]|uniref:Uncharacterized protein n=1 Tax=Tilletia horrida TaxID=155126 RepID=A0AAN6G8Q5_9BASI|nr:hypothetical protein OC842_006172 [Tilletia horrida]
MHRYTEHITSDLDPEAPPDPEKVAAELAYANALIAAIHGTGGEFSNVLSGVTVNGSPATGDDYDTYDDYSAGIDYGGDPSDLSDDRVTMFSIKFIRLYQSLFNVAGISATNMALVIQHLTRGGLTFQRQRATHSVSDQLHRQLKAALTWLTVVEQYCDKLALEGSVRVSAPRPLIEDDDLDLQLRH